MNKWREYELGEVVISANTGLDAIKRAPIVNENTGVKCLRIQDVSQKKSFENWGFTKVSENNYSKFQLKKNDIIVARTGATVGVNLFIEKNLNSVFNNGLIRLRTISKFDPKFINYQLKSPKFWEHIYGIAFGTTSQPNIQINQLLGFKLKAPNLATQIAIAEILSSLDDKIELNNQINQNLEALAQALFKQWFVDFEFPYENGEPYKSSGGEMVDSELGEIPKGWEVKQLDEFGEVICGKTPSKSDPENFGTDIPFVKIPDMHGKSFITQTTESLSIKGANSQKKKLLPKGSVMISSIATVGLVSMTTREVQTNQQINSIIPNSPKLTYFIYFLCEELKPTFLNLASGGAVTLNMNTSTFKSLKVIHPQNEYLEDFHEKVEPFFEQILTLQIENEYLIKLRDTLLPKLISGEIEVKEAMEQIS